MGLLNILGVFVAAVSVSALAADPPVPRGNVSATLNPTTGYYSSTNSTVRLPSGVSISPTPTTVPVVSKYAGGLQQTIPTGVTIDAIKKSAPLPMVVRSTTQSVKGAATRCLTSARCNIAMMAGAAGLQKLLDGLDWVMDEGGKIQKKGEYSRDYSGHYDYTRPTSTCYSCDSPNYIIVERREGQSWLFCHVTQYHFVGSKGRQCFYTFDPVEAELIPVSLPEISSGVDSNYEPEPSDWPALTPELELDDVEITSAPTLQGNPKTTTVYDADGNPHKVTETNIWYDFDIRDNPSPSPALDVNTTEETKTYEDGVLTGTTTTESTATGGSGGTPPSESDIPTDCDFMPTVCAFIDWFKDDDTPDEPDLSALIDDRDFTESYNISGGSKQCPPDYEFTIDLVGRTYGLSFEPACDFASKMYYFTMAAAYIFAAYITVGAVRRG